MCSEGRYSGSATNHQPGILLPPHSRSDRTNQSFTRFPEKPKCSMYVPLFFFIPHGESAWAFIPNHEFFWPVIRADTVEIKRLFLPVSMQLFFDLSLSGVLQLPTGFRSSHEGFLDCILSSWCLCEEKRSGVSYSAILVTIKLSVDIYYHINLRNFVHFTY